MRFRKKFWTKIIFMNIMVIMMVVLIFTLMRFYTSLSKERENIHNLMKQITDINSSQLTRMFDELDQLTYNIVVADQVQEVLKKAADYQGSRNYFDENLEEKRSLIRLMQLLAGENLMDTSVDLISVRGDYVILDTYASLMFNRKYMLEISKMGRFQELDKSKFIENIAGDSFGRTGEPMFSYLREVSDGFRDYGYIEIQKTVSSLNHIFQASADTFDMLSVTTHDGALFYTTNPDFLENEKYIQILDTYVPEESETGYYVRAEIKHNMYLLYASAVDQYGMRVYTLLPESYYTGRIGGEVLMLVLQGVATVIAMIVLITLVSYRIYQPVVALRQKIKNYELNSPLAEMDDVGNTEDTDEIAAFNQAFHRMIARIQKQNDEIIQRKIRELQVSYQALQAQVSPHFLYNTLYLIGLKGEEHSAPEILDMCSNLSRMMSYCIDLQTDMVTFRQEILYMKQYLELMKFRYLDKLDYELEIDEGIKQLLVPKFILQPLVENCFTHGFKNSNAEQFMIRISLKQEGNGWNLTIEDNGIGFAKEEQARIAGDIDFIKQSILDASGNFIYETSGVGLINTYARLFISFSAAVHLLIGSGEMGGGLVQIICPAGKEAQENESDKNNYSGG